MKIIDRYKSDADFRKKATVGIIMGAVGIVIAIAGIFFSGDDKIEKDNTPVQTIQNYSDRQLDTTLINKQTSDYRRMEYEKDTTLDKMNSSYVKNENSDIYLRNASGSAVVNSNGTPIGNSSSSAGGGGAALNEYMKRRNQSIERVYNSQPSSPQVVPTNQRDMVLKDYTPRSTSVQPYSVPSSVGNVDYISRNNNDNSNNNTPKQLTKEEKLQQAIASKYNSGGNALSKTSVTAQIYNNQKIKSNNTSVRLLLKDKIYFNNTTIGTDAFVYGIASINGDKVTISVPSITYKGTNYPVNLTVYDYRTGIKGIPINQDNIVGVASDVAENQVQQQASRLGGKVGAVLSQIVSGRNKTASIQLNDGHLLYLKTQ
ncbi:conjugative transposon protein TraM [Chryseobacterium sp. 18068]|uniref:conjugative transposon protein TraM n=1 Tax=Chryseobacterium sp. 18068 TaxID=2681414 RepID=UPI0013576956|nr:conjugative transposon protein TraM [Chryseobacterium sp. 18068]